MTYLAIRARLGRSASVCTAALALAAITSACGGDDEPADETSATITAFTMSAAKLTPPASGSARLDTSISGTFDIAPGKNITVSAHAIPASAPATALGTANRFMAQTCSYGLASLCGFSACTFSSGRALSCSSGSSVTLQPGSYIMVGRMCVQNLSNADVCDEERLNVVVE